jgi:serine/arginine repetitive matrix protein 2
LILAWHISVLSTSSGSDAANDTFYTMLNGDRVRRRSIGSSFEASPLFRADKRLGGKKLTRIESVDEMKAGDIEVEWRLEEEEEESVQQDYDDVELPRGLAPAQSIQSIQSARFGDRMDLARRGGLNRYSLEQSCLMSEGDISSSRESSFQSFPKY